MKRTRYNLTNHIATLTEENGRYDVRVERKHTNLIPIDYTFTSLEDALREILSYTDHECFEDAAELRRKAIDIIDNNDGIFDDLAFYTHCECDVDLFPMDCLNDGGFFENDASLTTIISKISHSFNTDDYCFYIEDGKFYSTSDTVTLFREHFTAEDILDRVLDEAYSDLRTLTEDNELNEILYTLDKYSEQ